MTQSQSKPNPQAPGPGPGPSPAPKPAPAAKPEPPAPPATGEVGARIITEFALPASLIEILKLGQTVDGTAVKVYFDSVMKSAGSPADPVEQMLLAQLTLAHHRLANLHAETAKNTTLDVVAVYNTAAARLMAEFRLMALAIKQYRTPVTGRSTTVNHVVHQQNIAKGGQQVSYSDGGEGGTTRMAAVDTELGGQPKESNDVGGRFKDEEPVAVGCGAAGTAQAGAHVS